MKLPSIRAVLIDGRTYVAVTPSGLAMVLVWNDGRQGPKGWVRPQRDRRFRYREAAFESWIDLEAAFDNAAGDLAAAGAPG